jgi:deoxyribose-phosphate aldolase
MNPDGATKLERRVVEAAEAALAARQFATAIDVFVGLGWLVPSRVDEWVRDVSTISSK